MIDFKRIFRSFVYAFSGLLYVIKTQNNARFHLLATFLVVIFSVWLKLNIPEWCLIFFAIGIVWISECFNTSIEKLFDLVNPDQHPLVKHGKDSGAAAVFMAALLSVVIGILVLGPRLYERIMGLFSK